MTVRRGAAPEPLPENEGLADGLSPLDEERAESMAAEGGRSAQAVTARAAVVDPSLLPRPRWPWWVALSLGAVLGYFGYLGLRRVA